MHSIILATLFCTVNRVNVLSEHSDEIGFRCAMFAPSELTRNRAAQLIRRGFNAIALDITSGAQPEKTAAAVRNAREAKTPTYYWIEVGRSPEMADAHPDWMASLQGHPEWRRLFPNFPKSGENETIKNYPWVPIYYRETFDAHLKRISELLSKLPRPDGIFLNDLQAAPSACGCGNTLCRWTTDYGPISTAKRLGNDAAGKFVAEVKKIAPGVPIIPVWLSECEEDEKQTYCAGVGCFEGTCWYSYTEQLMPVEGQCERIGALATSKALGKGGREAEGIAKWTRNAVGSFANMPPKRKGSAIEAKRVIAILQGWDVKQSDVDAQIASCREAGAGGYMVAFSEIKQGWEPRIFKLKAPDTSQSVTRPGNQAALH